MNAFLETHQKLIIGEITTFDRMIFKGHLSAFYPRGAFESFLSRQGVLLKDFGRYVEKVTKQVNEHAKMMAKKAGRPYIYLQSATTKASGVSKEDLARKIAAKDGVTEGLICAFSVLETCSSFTVRGNRETHKLEAVRRRTKCLHHYFYFIDPELGFMHLRLQSWFPFQIQVYINGREWLSRKLDDLGIGYRRRDNCLTWAEDFEKVHAVCERFAHRRWPGVLNTLARRFNPFLARIGNLGFGGYFWVLDQAEISTDVLFRDRASLNRIFPDLVQHAALHFSADNVLRFLGRKLSGNFRGEVTTDYKKRQEGRRVRHGMKRNSIKMYDKGSALRIETTINNPREFKVLRVEDTPEGRSRRWKPMGKGVANAWRYAQVGAQSNGRYLEALAQVQPKGQAIQEIESLSTSHERHGTHIPKLAPFSSREATLFQAVMAGENLINGFRNRDLVARLYSKPPSTPQDAKRRCARTSRQIAKLRGHGLLAKVKNSRLYHVTPRGFRIMSTALRVRYIVFPEALLQAA
jgi:hypothetical protein